jgi:hypothetical protein
MENADWVPGLYEGAKGLNPIGWLVMVANSIGWFVMVAILRRFSGNGRRGHKI